MDNEAARNAEMAREISILKKRIRELESPETPRKGTKSGIRESESQLEGMLDACFGSIVLHNREGTILKCNDVFARRFDRSKDKLIGEKVWPLFPPELRSSRQALLEKVFEEGKPLRNEDEWRGNWMKYVLHPIFAVDGSVGNVAVYAENITERKIARKSAEKSKQRYRELVENANCIILKWKRNGEITFLNEYGLSFFGFGEQEIFGKSAIGTIIPQTWENDHDLAASPDKVFEHPERYEKGIVQHVCRDGRCVLVSWTNRAVSDDRGNTVEIYSIGHDITDCKNAERALRESEQKYRIIAENMTDVITILDLDFHFTYISPSIVRMRGLTVEEAMAQPHEQRMTPESRQLLNRIFKEEMQREASGTANPNRVRTIELEMYRKDKSTIWVELIASFLRDKDGRTTGILSVTRNITERKRMEAALRESQRSLKEIIDFLPDATFVIDKTGKVTAWNRAIEDMTGVKAEDMIGKGEYEYALPLYGERRPVLIDLVLLSNEEFLKSHYNNIVRQGPVLQGEAFMPKTYAVKNAYLWGNAAKLYNEDGEVIGAIESLRDITERKEAEEALRESEDRYQSIFKNTGTGMVIIEEDGVISLANSEFEKLSGYKRHEIEGKKNWKEFTEKSDLERMIQQHRLRRVDPGLVEKKYEFRLVRRDGHIRNVYLTIDIIPGTRKSVASLLDITDRKEAEEKRRELEARLQRSEKMEALGLMAGGVAHDLNNVLGVVMGYSELLLDDIAESSSAKTYVSKIMAAGGRAAAVIEDMLTLARRGVQSRAAIELNILIRDFMNTPEFDRIAVFNPEVRIETRLKAESLRIMGSSVQLGKTIMNLVLNAVEAMPKGGRVTISTRNRYMDRPVEGYDEIREGDYVVLSVADSGEGISADDMKHIFEPFYTKKVMGRSGTGLGLSVVWGTVRDHNGYIDVQSEEGKGSTFTLYFPVTREEQSEERIPVSMSEYTGKGESILVVDDVREQRELAAGMLEKLNYHVEIVSGGEEAVEYMKDHRADLVVLDMIMDPGMDGLTTYRNILEIHPGQKAIIVSGFSETDRVRDAQALGAGPYVKKPYTLEKLGLAVREELDR